MNSVSDDVCARRLREALERGDLFLSYQPKIDLTSGMLSGVEALARWTDNLLGEVAPCSFVRVAERFGLIDALTEWVLREALRQWAEWREQGMELSLAVNLSALTLRNTAFPDQVQRLCMRRGMPCSLLTLEVTESATQDIVCLLETLSRFRLKGFGVSLDDFGTGYSSLAQLRQLPFSEVKIDQSFVRDAATAAESRLIVKTVIDLAHGLGLVATAEGVEDAATLALLRDLGCDQAQGFFIGRPMRGEKLLDWMRHEAAGSNAPARPSAAASSADCSDEPWRGCSSNTVPPPDSDFHRHDRERASGTFGRR